MRGGWRVYTSDDAASLNGRLGTRTEVENADASVAVEDSIHTLSAGTHPRWRWLSTTKDAGGSLQDDWVVRELTVAGGSNVLNGTSRQLLAATTRPLPLT